MTKVKEFLQRNKNKTKLTLAKSIVLLSLFLLPNTALALTMDEVNQQINDAQNKLNQTTSQKNTLAGEVASFDNQISYIQGLINGTDAEIAKTQADIVETNNQIVVAEAELAKIRSQLSEIMRVSYEDGQVTTLELIAKSNNFSDFVNRSEYIEVMQVKIKDISDKVIQLKTTLEQNKKSLEDSKAKSEQLLRDQQLQRNALANQRASKNSLLSRTKGDEKAYQNTLNNLYAIRAALSAESNEGVSTGGTGGYPYSGADPNGIDPWHFYYRQCTSYAAWRSANMGPVPGSVLSDWGSGHTANGGDWGNLGSSHGRSVSYSPSAGAIMSFPYQYGLPYGHVAIVDSVNGDGTVNISEYNWSIPLGFGRRTSVNPVRWSAVFIR